MPFRNSCPRGRKRRSRSAGIAGLTKTIPALPRVIFDESGNKKPDILVLCITALIVFWSGAGFPAAAQEVGKSLFMRHRREIPLKLIPSLEVEDVEGKPRRPPRRWNIINIHVLQIMADVFSDCDGPERTKPGRRCVTSGVSRISNRSAT